MTKLSEDAKKTLIRLAEKPGDPTTAPLGLSEDMMVLKHTPAGTVVGWSLSDAGVAAQKAALDERIKALRAARKALD